MKKIWLDNKLVPAAQAKVSVLNRGFLYGDGIYEAVRVYGGKIFRAEEHWRRMDGSLRSVFMRIPWSHAQLTRFCLTTAKANGLAEAMVRVTISRGVGHLGYDPASCGKPTLTVIATPVNPQLPQLWKRGVKTAIVSVRRNPIQSLNPAIKHTNSLNGILAKIESLKSKAFEGIFLNIDGHVAEGTISNIFLIKNGVVQTPSLDCGILDGVTRQAVMQAARKNKLTVRETKISPQALLAADEVFLTSTTMEVLPVTQIGKTKIAFGPLAPQIHRRLRELIAAELKFGPDFVAALD